MIPQQLAEVKKKSKQKDEKKMYCRYSKAFLIVNG